MLQKQWDDGVVRVDAWRLQAGRVSSCDALVTECPAEQGACASMAKPGQPWDCTDQPSNRSNHLPTHAALGLKSKKGGEGWAKGVGRGVWLREIGKSSLLPVGIPRRELRQQSGPGSMFWSGANTLGEERSRAGSLLTPQSAKLLIQSKDGGRSVPSRPARKRRMAEVLLCFADYVWSISYSCVDLTRLRLVSVPP
ncbi:hypothetical protein LZ31DRAFT_251133 [Colletotrichum somersetense]|nr:hypothetical protein LZ31DRAFT_251133 [Colletotrichum somersetense]